MGKHVGLSKLKRKVAARGMAAVDRRGAAAKAVRAWREELLVDLGGIENVSLQRRTLVELAARTQLFIDHVDSFLLEQGDLINRGKRSLYPVVAQRQTLVDSLARLLAQLGLERQAKPVEDLITYQQRRAAELEGKICDEQQAEAADDLASD